MFADGKEKYDPRECRDAVIAGLEKAGNDLEVISKYLDTAGSGLSSLQKSSFWHFNGWWFIGNRSINSLRWRSEE